MRHTLAYNDRPTRLLMTALLMSFAVAACAQQATIKGILGGYKGESVVIKIDGEANPLTVAPDGTFEVRVKVSKPGTKGIVMMTNSSTVPPVDFRVAPGATVAFDLTQDGGDIKVKFSGYKADYNNYLTALRIVTDWQRWDQEQYVKDPFPVFAASVDKALAPLAGYLAKIEDPDLRAVETLELKYRAEGMKFPYIWGVQRYNNLPLDSNPEFNEFARNIDMNNRDAIGPHGAYGHYAYLVSQRLMWEQRINPEKYKKNSGTLSKMSLIMQNVEDEVVRNLLLSDAIEMYLSGGGDKHLVENYETFTKLCTDEAALARVAQTYRELNELGPGKLAPDFTLIAPDGSRLKLSDLRGKVLYIDVWATWCGPCVSEIPFMEKLWEKYGDNPNLEFVSISTDHNEDSWKKKLAQDKPGWKNFVTEGGMRGPLNQLYGISGIPRFMLIDKDGRIINVNAARPSSPDIEQVLAPYL